jgi:uncharacterized protein (DUF58 family)
VTAGPSLPAPILDPGAIGRLGRLRLAGRRRVEGRFAGAHASRRYGASLDFADYREYVPGDDPRHVDPHAHARLGRYLVKLYEAEDEAALRVVLDLSASMGFDRKLHATRQVALALAVVAAAGGDRIRILAAGGGVVEPGPWFRGPATLPAVAARVGVLAADLPAAAGRPQPADPVALAAAVRRAHAEGPRGPVVLVSDLLFDGYDEVLAALGAGRGDAVLVHLLGRRDLDPALDPSVGGDLRLVDSETGAEVEVGIAEDTLAAYAAARDDWLDAVDEACGRRGVLSVRHVDDEAVEPLVAVRLAALGMVA